MGVRIMATVTARQLRAYIRSKLRAYRKRLWDYYTFRELYRCDHGNYGPLAQLRELPRLIEEMEDILAYCVVAKR